MSLTIQAPHANMNAYEIGDDETRKNKVSDKGTIYAGDLQFAQTTGNAASDKKQSARKQAMKLIRDAWDSDNKAVSQRDQIAQQKEEKWEELERIARKGIATLPMISDVISTDKVTIKPDEFAFTSFGELSQTVTFLADVYFCNE
jgi:hypothetical protein